MLTGILELDGVAVARGRVLLISGDMTRLLESTTTDDSGVFRFTVTDVAQSTVVVLAKIQEQVLSIAYRIIDLAIHGPGPHRIAPDPAWWDPWSTPLAAPWRALSCSGRAVALRSRTSEGGRLSLSTSAQRRDAPARTTRGRRCSTTMQPFGTGDVPSPAFTRTKPCMILS